MKWLSFDEVIEFLNSLNGYEGFVRYSHRPINEKDVFRGDVNVKKEEGFIIEAFFCNGKKSIEVKQINDRFLVNEIEIPKNVDNKDIDTFESKIVGKVKMLQIWEEVEDDDFSRFKVKKLKNVIFYGFEGE